jgi:hypothetical protein
MANVSVTGLDKLVAKFNSMPDKLQVGIKVIGPAAAYAMVWERGAIHLSQPGPKTMWSTNADGETVILTIQAPHGYIRLHKQEYAAMIQDELHQADFGGQDYEEVLRQVMDNASDRAAALAAATAPVDTGQLQSSIVAVHTKDFE